VETVNQAAASAKDHTIFPIFSMILNLKYKLILKYTLIIILFNIIVKEFLIKLLGKFYYI
jgi:hypothetical protein